MHPGVLFCGLTFLFQQRWAHEKPAIFYSIIIGFGSPILAYTVPPFRRNYLGYVPPERLPTTYPCATFIVSIPCPGVYPCIVPQRARQPVHGYEDE